MKGKWLGIFLVVTAAAALLAGVSCAHSQQLVSIQIQPSSETIGAANIPLSVDAGQQVQLTALGSYIHPPVTKDITSQVTWASSSPQMFTISPGGLLTATGLACGATLVSATVTTNTSAGGISSQGAVVTGYMTGNVVCFEGSGSGGNLAALTVTFGPNGSGSVTSNPTGIVGCFTPGPCSANFTIGQTVSLTATPANGSTFTSWVGCDSLGTTNPCSVTMNANRNVIANFQ